MQEIIEYLEKAKVYYLATVSNNQPSVRPFGTVDFYNGHICFQTGLSKKVAKDMINNPCVEICAMADATSWIRIKGFVMLEESIDAQEHMLNKYPHLRSMYTPGDGNTAIFYFHHGVATISSFTEKPKTIEF